MPRLRVRTVVPGSLEQVYQHVTDFPVDGQPNNEALEARHGKLQGREGNTLTFLEPVGDGLTWQCTYDPPHQRVMRAVDSTWSDRTDRFEPVDGGTLWTIIWELKATGLARYTKWLAFLVRDKKRVYRQMVLPVVEHFQVASTSQ